MSDLHTDSSENLKFIEEIDPVAHRKDALLVAGDVSDSVDVVRHTLRALRAKFAAVFYVAGNHDLWVVRRTSPKGVDSLEKLQQLDEMCNQEGIETRPCRYASPAPGAGGIWIVPLLSWHCAAFDTEPEIDDRWEGIPAATDICSDYHLCKWPAPLNHMDDSVAAHLDKMNDQRIAESGQAEQGRLRALFNGHRQANDIVISFSHFLPRIELLPEKRYLYVPTLAKFVGSTWLGRRVEQLRPDVHVFGHTHFGWDQELGGIRYVSPPMGMPREREQRLSTIATGQFPIGSMQHDTIAQPLLIWNGAHGFSQPYQAGWSGFYEQHQREPEQVAVLPDYVARAYTWDEKKYGPKSAFVGWQGKRPAWEFGPAWTRDQKRHH